MSQEFDDLVSRLKRRNDEIQSQIDGARGSETNDLIDKLQELRRRAEETNSRGPKTTRR
jgi:hypothetical protein